MKRLLSSLIILALGSNLFAQTKPNIILILADDMGWTDLSSFGSKSYESPNIDRLAASGMKFTKAYSACTVCSPTRASIMTGKAPARLHLTDWIAGQKMPFAKLSPPDWTTHLPLEETTIAEVLKKNGYATGAIGKWHLGASEKYAPEHQGFDYYSDQGSNSMPVSATNVNGKGTKEITDAAVKFINEKKNKPFFLYLPFYAVHLPLQAPEADVEYFKGKINPKSAQNNATYAGMVKELDRGVGRIVDKVKELNLASNTLIIFISDNGGLIGNAAKGNGITSNLPLRDGKGSAYMGGVRVPGIFSWQGKIKPGTTSSEQIISTDLFSTIANIAGAKETKSVDGNSILPVLMGATLKKPLHDDLYWHYPHYHNGGATPYSGILEGNKHLVYFYETGKKEYYDIGSDISEKNDLYPTHTKEAEALYAKLQAWLAETKAQPPVPNPKYDESKKNQKAGGGEN
jgi:arylsulfatase A-like enzyme